jgi:hypothetical protein
MTDYQCFCDWARGHIQDVYNLTGDDDIPIDIDQFIVTCTEDALIDFTPEEQYEIVGFTLDQIQNEDLLDQFYSKFSKAS